MASVRTTDCRGESVNRDSVTNAEIQEEARRRGRGWRGRSGESSGLGAPGGGAAPSAGGVDVGSRRPAGLLPGFWPERQDGRGVIDRVVHGRKVGLGKSKFRFGHGTFEMLIKHSKENTNLADGL